MSWRVPALLLLITWGVCAFGAVYPWAFIPLYGGCAVVAVVMLAQRRAAAPAGRAPVIALLFVVAAIVAQLVPVPLSLIQRISPETDTFLRWYQVGYRSLSTHPLSIQPNATVVGLAAACALGILLVALARGMNRQDTIQFIRGLCVLGAVLAIEGIAQRALWNGKIYGFWTPVHSGNPFGPFVNRNHFAGWMLMALPLAMGYFCGRVSRGMQAVPPGWRNRAIWFSSPDASETVLVGFAVLLMALGLTMTTSRSGVLGLVAALTVSGWLVARHHRTMSRRLVATVFIAFVLFAAVGWAGVDRIALRFASDASFGNRGPIWMDTLRIARRFPLVGTGFNTYGTSTLLYQSVIPEVHLAEAHNDYLQLLAEGGALVAIPAIALLIVVGATIVRRFRSVRPGSTDYWIRAGAVTGILAIAIQEIGEFSLQMPGNAVLFVALLAVAIRPVDAVLERRSHSRPDLQ
jgi:O-antigen ligase